MGWGGGKKASLCPHTWGNACKKEREIEREMARKRWMKCFSHKFKVFVCMTEWMMALGDVPK